MVWPKKKNLLEFWSLKDLQYLFNMPIDPDIVDELSVAPLELSDYIASKVGLSDRLTRYQRLDSSSSDDTVHVLSLFLFSVSTHRRGGQILQKMFWDA